MLDSTSWLWRHWIPRGRLSFISGPEGSETFNVAVWLVASLLKGGPWPDGATVEADSACRVMWLDTQGRYKRLDDRLRFRGAPGKSVFLPVRPDRPHELYVDLGDRTWLETVAASAAQERPAWVIVDGLTPSGDLVVLAAMAEVARNVGCPVTFLTAPVGARSWARITDKISVVLELSRSDPATQMQLRVVKSLDNPPEPLWLRLDGDLPEVVGEPPSPPARMTSLDRAVLFLKEQLACGPRPAVELTEEAKRNGTAARTLQRAKQVTGVASYFAEGRWWWDLS